MHFSANFAPRTRELSRFIYGGRLNCVIDKVAGIVETNRPDTKNAQYQVRRANTPAAELAGRSH